MSLFDGMLLETEKPYRKYLTLPNGEPWKDKDGVRAYIDVYSTDSSLAQKIKNKRRNDAIENGIPKMTAEAEEELSVNTMADLSAGWYLVRFDGNALTDGDGKPLPFSTANARALFAEPGAAPIFDQAKIGAGMRVNFTPALPSA